jgi:FkbM family methyltransferase
MSAIIEGKGIYEPHVTQVLAHVLRSGDVFVDAGANLGYFTILAAKRVGPAGKVIAFEPASTPYRYCKFNLELNCLVNVTLLQMALWDDYAYKEIYTSPIFLGGAHLEQTEVSETPPGHTKEAIRCVPLDGLIASTIKVERIRLIKLDIEGAEPFALRGMRKALLNNRPLLLVEVNRHCLQDFFSLDTEAIWGQLVDLDYRAFLFPVQVPAAAFANLPTATVLGSLPMIAASDVAALNTVIQPQVPVDVLAIPAEQCP